MDPFPYLLLSPPHIASHRSRLKKIHVLKENVMHTIRSFESYANAGDHFSAAMDELAESFDRYNALEKDTTFRDISRLITAFRQNLSVLFTQVREFVVTPLRDFLTSEVATAEDLSRVSDRELENYLRALDNCASGTKRRSTVGSPTAVPRTISEAHRAAAEADLRFEQALVKVERKTLIAVSSNFLMFINLSSVAFKQCISDHDSATANFSELTAAISAPFANQATLADDEKAQLKRLRACHEEYWRCRAGEFAGTTALVHGGYLWRQRHGIRKPWQRRFFQVDNYKMSYLSDKSEIGENVHEKGEVDLTTISVRPLTDVVDRDRPFCFSVISPHMKKTWVLQALTKYDLDEWQAVLQNNIQYLLDHTMTGGLSAATVSESGFDPREFNPTCADCGSLGPSWCCLNWGTCICIKCAGVHREMSTAVSKVRSLTLDHLADHLLALFRVIGNAYANEVLTQLLPPGTSINESCDRAARGAFLRRKYERCEFVDTSERIELEQAVTARDVRAVYRSLCQMRKLGVAVERELSRAAAMGDPSACLLIGFNSGNIDRLDRQGWGPLSYAAYNGNADAASALLLVGCSPTASPQAQPYFLALAKNDPELVTLFLPYCTEARDADAPLPVTSRPAFEVDRTLRYARRANRMSIMLMPRLSVRSAD
jgi:hypothetical protein